ncbi:12-oxophytodienoate reductase [Capsulimonas corticalis]|uniref:12-oxophytodienoate reductase n=2 Tax=Capsulimonas corticalis TaxID=2219043 RepID=A0A402CNK3_9BACT|nr:NADH:flavin oxidoreductase [Capsulimonas corticalis]BDI33313.1 12-oxophytodienoate reductase [Capsulimonas corticalis]
MDTLFQPITIKGLTLPNRIVMAPMTRTFSPGGIPTKDVAEYYARRAAAQVGLIISEGTGIARPTSLNHRDIPRFHGERELTGWKQVIDGVHAAGGLMAPQLWHVGAVRAQGSDWPADSDYEGPSGLNAPGAPLGKAMTDEDIADTIAAYASAAADAKRLGFDAAELHGAHGYLIDQFFWAGTNQRSDRFNGPTIAERGRFAAEVIRAVRAAVGPDFPLIIRLSQWKQQDFNARLANTPAEMEAWLQPLVDAGADILHCSQRRFWDPEFEGSDLNFAGWAKKLTGVPTIAVGSVGLNGDFVAAFGGESSQPASLDELTRRLDRGDFDLIAVGRAILQDPHWAVKVRERRTEELMNFETSALASLS